MTMSSSSVDEDISAKRRRRNPAQLYSSYLSGSSYDAKLAEEEERLIAQAIANSRIDNRRDDEWLEKNVPFGPTFYPTVEDFRGDPLEYLEKVKHEAVKYGICKIVPPKGWDPPFSVNVDCEKRFQTKDQSIHRLQEGISFGDGTEYTIKEYQRMASDWSKAWRDQHYNALHQVEQLEVKPSVTAESIDEGTAGTEDDSRDTTDYSKNEVTATSAAPSDTHHCSESNVSVSGDAHGQNETCSRQKLKPLMTPANLEYDYWDIVETQRYEIDVDYGNDVDTASAFGSGFPISERGRSVNSSNFQCSQDELPEPEFGTEEYYKETFWNLNNIPNSKTSVLRHVKVGINGINVPWLYFGALFSTFCWHTEDNYMYSINYHHRGAPKQWYGVPGTKEDADGVERVFKNYLSLKLRDVPDLIHHITTSFSPRVLKQEGVRVCKILQNAGEFIVTFPRAFHGGFSLGPNVGEAVNFASHDWLQHGVDANERYRTFARPSVFSHDRLVYTIAHHIEELLTPDICKSLAQELSRLMGEELLMRTKLLKAGVRDVSKEVELPANKLDALDEESADYDDKRLCHSCKHICFFSAVACECSESKVSCLRHSHYMCRCTTKRKYLLIWTTEDEMKETLARVEMRGEQLEKVSKSVSQSSCGVTSNHGSTDGASGSSGDLLHHQTYVVPVEPICPLETEVPALVTSDTSTCD
mmetsp:Transcript_28095/g.57486  ORF Transcript_28095/g.57486 Transcript_28095/m.57486 type:complete len:699 (-) Transcript_28095:1291-3387(-)